METFTASPSVSGTVVHIMDAIHVNLPLSRKTLCVIYLLISVRGILTGGVHSTTVQCLPCICHRPTQETLEADCSLKQLKEVPSGLPADLTFLDLSHNTISSIPRQYFEQFPRINSLNLSFNPLGLKNASESFYGLQTSFIKSLNLTGLEAYSGCVIIEKNFFKYLTKTPLEEIYLDENWILKIETSAISTFAPQTIQVLSIRKSRFLLEMDFVSQLFSLVNLKKIDISERNNDNNFHMSRKIKSATFNNSVTRYKHSQKRRPRGIVSISDVIFHFPPKLEEVIVNDCYIKASEVSVKFQNSSLKRIMARNNIFCFSEVVYGDFDSLEEVDFSNNYCNYFFKNVSSVMPSIKKLFLKGNNNDFIRNKYAFQNLVNLTHLDLSSNRISKLPKEAFKNLYSMQCLLLKGNIIYKFETNIVDMVQLTTLDLSDNQLTSLARSAIHQLETIHHNSNLTLDLTGNPFICSCFTLYFIEWILYTDINIISRDNLSCVYEDDRNQRNKMFLMKRELDKTCVSYFGVAMGTLVLVTGSIIIAVMGVVHRFRWKLRYLYYIARGKYRNNLVNQHREGADFVYDAFIAYAEEDAEFVINNLIIKLEDEGQLRLCLHQRDFRPGQSIAANILTAIQRSRHVVIVLSLNFLDSYWCRWEFEMARMEGLYTERNVLILVRYQEVLPSVVPRDMLYMMHTQTYLEYPEGQQDQDTFWTALRQALDDD